MHRCTMSSHLLTLTLFSALNNRPTFADFLTSGWAANQRYSNVYL